MTGLSCMSGKLYSDFGDVKIRILEYNNLGDLFSDHY